MTRKRLILLATLGSAALLAGAYAFQFLGGMAPCHLCLWQRYPHMAAVLIGAVALATRHRWLSSAGALAAATSAAIGFYHTGVERHWWQGPSSCTSGSVAGVSPDDLLSTIMNAPLVQCDQVAWSMWGLSMASWNMVLSLLLALIWLASARKTG